MEYVLLAGAVCVVFFSCAQLMTRDKQPIHYFMITGCLCASYAALYLFALEAGLLRRVPALAGTDAAVTFPAAASFYLASLSVLREGRAPVRGRTVYVMAAALALGTAVYDVLTAPAFLRDHGRIPDDFSSPARFALSLAANGAFLVAIIGDLLEALRLRRKGFIGSRAGFRHQVVFLFLYLAVGVAMLSRFVVRSELPYEIAASALCLIIFAFGLTRIAVTYHAPDGVPRAVVRGPRRPEWDGAAEEISHLLEETMQREAPYRDERLTLRGLATRLGVEPRHLTYHLHKHLSTSFRAYINDWRLRAVCRDLADDPGKPILQVAFDNGFNSKSSFNTLFYRTYGETPRAFRQRSARAVAGGR